MKFDCYLLFNGNCAEASQFYKELFGAAALNMMTWGDSPMADQMPPEKQGEIMHAQMPLGASSLMGADAGTMFQQPQGFRVAFEADSAEDAERVFAALSEGGTVFMPMSETFWANRFGMLTDRFGIPWMVNHSKPMGA